MEEQKQDVEPVEFATEETKSQPYSQPMVTEKLYKKLEKLIRSAVEIHACSRGVKEVTKTLRKKHKGICLIAGDCTPIDVIAHLPVYCEDRSVPYAFVPSKRLLGATIGSLRGTSCILIMPTSLKKGEGKDIGSYTALYKKLLKKMKALKPSHLQC